MIKKIVFLSLIVCLFSCKEEQNGYEINASVDSSANNQVAQLFRMDNSNRIIEDSTTVKDGKIVFKGNIESPDIHFITINSINGSLPIILENTKMDITIYKDSLPKSLIEGSKENDITKKYIKEAKFLSVLNKKLMERSKKAQQSGSPEAMAAIRTSYDSFIKVAIDFDKAFIKENGDYTFAAITLERIVRGNSSSTEEIEELYNSFSEKVKQSNPAKKVETYIKDNKNKKKSVPAIIGNIAPDFSGLTPEGKTLSLNDVKSKVTIIDFWASWCKPCRRENPNVVKLYEKYHDKGLEIIGVSLDNNGQKNRWVKAIEQDGLTWPQISNLKGWKEPVAVQYGVRSIPATFILDKTGKIVATRLRGKALEDKVEELLSL
ncbi:redoxin domain-containing protein [Pontimicrobium sp. MEBiC01747]